MGYVKEGGTRAPPGLLRNLLIRRNDRCHTRTLGIRAANNLLDILDSKNKNTISSARADILTPLRASLDSSKSDSKRKIQRSNNEKSNERDEDGDEEKRDDDDDEEENDNNNENKKITTRTTTSSRYRVHSPLNPFSSHTLTSSRHHVERDLEGCTQKTLTSLRDSFESFTNRLVRVLAESNDSVARVALMCLALDFNGPELDRVRPLRCIRKRCTLSAISKRSLHGDNYFKWILRPLPSLRHALEFGSLTKRDILHILKYMSVLKRKQFDDTLSSRNQWDISQERDLLRRIDNDTMLFPYDLTRNGSFQKWQRDHVKILSDSLYELNRDLSLENVLVIYERMLDSLSQINSDRLGISATLGQCVFDTAASESTKKGAEEEVKRAYETILMDSSWFFFAHLVSLACGGGETRLLNERQRRFEKVKELPIFMGDEGDGDLMEMFAISSNFSERFGTLFVCVLLFILSNVTLQCITY